MANSLAESDGEGLIDVKMLAKQLDATSKLLKGSMSPAHAWPDRLVKKCLPRMDKVLEGEGESISLSFNLSNSSVSASEQSSSVISLF